MNQLLWLSGLCFPQLQYEEFVLHHCLLQAESTTKPATLSPEDPARGPTQQIRPGGDPRILHFIKFPDDPHGYAYGNNGLDIAKKIQNMSGAHFTIRKEGRGTSRRSQINNPFHGDT